MSENSEYNQLAERVAIIMAAALGIEKLGILENFFRVGGDSIHANIVLARLHREFGTQLTYSVFASEPTAKSVAASVISAKGHFYEAVAASPVRKSHHRASRAQTAIWMASAADKTGHAYNLLEAWELQGRLDVASLSNALKSFVELNESFRTVYRFTDSCLYQEVIPGPKQALFVELFDTYNVDKISSRIKALASIPFDLTSSVPFRFILFTDNSNNHVLAFIIHHIACDGWSNQLLKESLKRNYPSREALYNSNVASGRLQYRDYSSWANERALASIAAVAFWNRTLRGAVPQRPFKPDLNTHRSRQDSIYSESGYIDFAIDRSILDIINIYSTKASVTLFTSLIAAFVILVHDDLDEDDIIVGFPVANRGRTEFEDVVGNFTSLALLRQSMTGQPTFDSVVKSISVFMQKAIDFDNVPVDELLKHLRHGRSEEFSKIVPTVFSYTKDTAVELNGLRAKPLRIPFSGAKFPINFRLLHNSEDLKGIVEYHNASYSTKRINDLVDRYLLILKKLCTCPTEPVKFLLQEPNQIGVVKPSDVEQIDNLFAKQVALTPDAVAIIFGDIRITYFDLQLRSKAYAEKLVQAGVVKNDVVVSKLPRSPDALAVMLATFAVGGVHAYIDPSYPVERQDLLTRVVCGRFIVSVDAKNNAVPFRIVALTLGNASTVEIPSGQAYITFTSGSSGQPKAVLGSHAAAVAYLREMAGICRLIPGDLVLQLPPLGFDSSIRDIFTTFTSGATLRLLPQSDTVDFSEYLVHVASGGITAILSATPTLAYAIAESPEVRRNPGKLRLILCSGERLSTRTILLLRERISQDLRILGLYGPTEATMTSTYFEVPNDLSHLDVFIPAGYPHPKVNVVIVNPERSKLSHSTVGEICIAGYGIGHGYLGAAHDISKRFINVLGEGGLFYRTGDYGYLAKDGCLYYQGRIDRQLKIHGYRVEPSEVETALMRCPDVVEAAVIGEARSESEALSLVAYVVVNDSRPELTTQSIRDHIAKQLPAYMVPATIFRLSHFPRTVNGKVDYGALKAIRANPACLNVSNFNPRRLHEILERIWCETLGRTAIGTHETFFSVGGHSLLVHQVLFRIERELGIQVSIWEFFEGPTLLELTKLLTARQQSALGQIDTSLIDNGTWHAGSAQRRLWMIDQIYPLARAYIILCAWRVDGSIDVERLKDATCCLVDKHASLRSRFRLESDMLLQEIVDADSSCFVDLGRPENLPNSGCSSTNGALDRIIDEAYTCIDIHSGPVFQVFVCREQDGTPVVGVAVHHAFCDGWSLKLVLRELSFFYTAGSRSTLPIDDSQLTYRQWTNFEAERSQTDDYKAALAYWTNYLNSCPETSTVPYNISVNDDDNHFSNDYSFIIPDDLKHRIYSATKLAGVTTFEFLITAFSVALGQVSEQDDICVGYPVANREPGTDKVIGLFANTLVLRISVQQPLKWNALILETKQCLREGLRYGFVPLDDIVRATCFSRRGLSPIVQTLFSVSYDEPFEIPDAKLTRLSIPSRYSKVDLACHFAVIGSSLTGTISYRSSLYTAEAINFFYQRYLSVLGEAAAFLTRC